MRRTLPPRARAPALLLVAVLAGCASVEREQAIDVARDWSQRVDAQAPQLHAETVPNAAQREARERLLAEPLSENAALQLALAQSPALQALLAEGWRTQAEAAQRGAPPNPFFLFERVVTDGDVDITRLLGIGLTELLTWPWRSDIAAAEIQALRLQLAREVLAHNTEVRAAWVRAVAAQQLVVYHRQVQEAAAASAELARRMQAVGNFSRLQRARAGLLAEATTQLARAWPGHGRTRGAGAQARPGCRRRRACSCPSACPTCRPRRPGDRCAARWTSAGPAAARAQLGAAQRALGLETVQLFDLELAAAREQGPGGSRARGVEAAIRLPPLDPGIALRQASSARLLAAQRRFEQARIDAGSVLRERYALYRSALDLAHWQRDEVVPLRRTITDEMLLKYNGMLVGVFELLADARAQVGAVIAAIEAQRDFWLADAALNAAIVGAPVQAQPLAAAAPRPRPRDIDMARDDTFSAARCCSAQRPWAAARWPRCPRPPPPRRRRRWRRRCTLSDRPPHRRWSRSTAGRCPGA